jgi:hypothetical protein
MHIYHTVSPTAFILHVASLARTRMRIDTISTGAAGVTTVGKVCLNSPCCFCTPLHLILPIGLVATNQRGILSSTVDLVGSYQPKGYFIQYCRLDNLILGDFIHHIFSASCQIEIIQGEYR